MSTQSVRTSNPFLLPALAALALTLPAAGLRAQDTAAAGAASTTAGTATPEAGTALVVPTAPTAAEAARGSQPEVIPPAPAPAAPLAAPAAAPVAAPAAAPAEEPHARLDYSDGSFYLRSVNDNVVFVPGGRMHIDTYSFAGPGVSDYHRSNGTGLKTNIFFRRFVIEIGGLIRKRWFYWIGGNFAPTTIDGNQNPISSANVYDGFMGYVINPRHRIYFGQYNAPFTMENVTSSRWLDFMERSLVVRTLATPYNKADGLTAWGETRNKSFEYQVGVFGGDGMNRPNVDNRFDGMGRFVVRPLAGRSDELRRFHIGAGARVGGRTSGFVRYTAPSLSTPGGYAFWNTTYTDTQSSGTGSTKVAVLPSGLQAAVSGEFYLPFERWDVRGEVAYINENRREAPDADRATTLRRGSFSGVGAYAQLSFWPLGSPRINGNPAGTYGVIRLPDGLGRQAPNALQVLLRAEIMRMNYSGNSRSGTTTGSLSSQTQNINVNAYQFAVNYWATKHVRLTAEYSLYQFPGGASNNQAVAPGRAANPGSNAHVLNEFSLRVGLAL